MIALNSSAYLPVEENDSAADHAMRKIGNELDRWKQGRLSDDAARKRIKAILTTVRVSAQPRSFEDPST
jgi:hypothetical protein